MADEEKKDEGAAEAEPAAPTLDDYLADERVAPVTAKFPGAFVHAWTFEDEITLVVNSEKIREVCAAFKEDGYTIALDDYIFTDDKTPMFDIIDIIKIDLLECDRDKLADEVSRLKSYNVKLLAEKVETQEEFEMCRQLGFDYYQGYFFSKPNIVSGQSLKANRVSLMKMLAMLQDPDCDIKDLENQISPAAFI